MKQKVLLNPQKVLIREMLVTWAGIAALCAALVILLMNLDNRVRVITSMRLDAAREAEQADVFLTLVKQEELVAPYYTRLQNILPIKERLIAFDQDLARVAKELGVGFGLTVRGENPASESTPGSLAIFMTLQGNIDNIAAYLKRLRTVPYFIELPSLEVDVYGGGYLLQLSGNVYTR